MNRALVTLGVLLSIGASALAQDRRDEDLAKLPPVLRKYVLARQSARYSGVRTVRFKRESEWVDHTEFVLKDGRRIRTEFPGDSEYRGQIIVDDGTRRMHFYPDRNEIEVEPARNRDSMHLGAAGRSSANRVVTDGGMVAGYSTQLVTISDKSGNNLQQMWIEPKTGVRLKLVLFDHVGSQAGFYEFTKINFKPKFAPGDFTIDRKGATVVTPLMLARRLAEKLGLTPQTLGIGSGYELENARIIHPDKKEVLSQTYVGNAGRFTFFQMRGDIDQKRLSKFARGRLSTYSWKRGPESFAIVGNLTQDQLREIAKTLGDR